ncbi:transglutaminase domain-containing protein [Hymenobacter endophyticus]|uniref:Transglutaminase domain-containing protein n=1 Tax=Hymenobacter endophyticus TaxID=3076335 RepID=A0ABU3TGA7_9BACT|nr:transglutaminase domain-containing protein [Hymenobacter endophyticus]MDU0370406.1 transglutaminase domain-containing protein [Hymenobacter endophyticus]
MSFIYSTPGRVLATVGLLLRAATAHAQEEPIKFGKLDAKEAAALLASPTPDSAAAEVLCDFGQSSIQGKKDGFELRFARTARLLIRRPAGYEHATVRVYLYHDPKNGGHEEIQQLKGFTYNLTAGVLSKEPLRTEAVFSKKINERLNEYAFTLPNVRENSILEFTYVVRSPFLFNLQDWTFQQDIPVRWSEYRTVIPSFYRYKETTRTYWPFTINETGTKPYATSYREGSNSGYGSTNAGASDNVYSITTQAVTRRWAIKNLPAFHSEPFMTTRRDYLSQVDFELERIQFDPQRDPQFIVGSWPEIEKELLEDERFGQYLKANSPVTALAAVLQPMPNPTERAQAVRQLIMQHVAYDDTPASHARPGSTAKRVAEQRKGNAAEVNLLLVAALRAAGLDAQPLLLSTRSNGRIQTELPVVSQFNYVVAHVLLPDNKELLLDATDASLPPTLLPENCLNGQGRLLGPAGRWVNLMDTAPTLLYTRAQLMATPQGELQGSIRQEYAGYAASNYRRPLPELRQNWQKAHPDWQISKASVLAPDVSRPVALELTASLPGAEAPAATLYLRPLQQLVFSGNLFQADERLFPVDFATVQRFEYATDLTLPAGYAVAELPANMQLVLPDGGGRFLFNVTQPTPQTLSLVGRLHLLKTHYTAEEYHALRAMYTQALSKLAEPIVLQRQ